MIIIETIMIDKFIFRKYLGSTPPLVHWLVDGKYNSVLERSPPNPLEPPVTNKPWELELEQGQISHSDLFSFGRCERGAGVAISGLEKVG